MPDTGAPYNIPFLDGSEIVRDYPQLSEDLADKIVEGLDAAGGLVQIVTETDTTTRTTTSTSFVSATLSATITPTAAGNTVFAIWTANPGPFRAAANFNHVQFRLVDGSTPLLGAETVDWILNAAQGSGTNILHRGPFTIIGRFTAADTTAVTIGTEFRVVEATSVSMRNGDSQTGVLTLVEVKV